MRVSALGPGLGACAHRLARAQVHGVGISVVQHDVSPARERVGRRGELVRRKWAWLELLRPRPALQPVPRQLELALEHQRALPC